MDPIADLLTCIRNANQGVETGDHGSPLKIKESTVKLLKEEGYLESYNVEGDVKRSIRIGLKFQGRKGVITDLQRVSVPGCAATPRPRTFR